MTNDRQTTGKAKKGGEDLNTSTCSWCCQPRPDRVCDVRVRLEYLCLSSVAYACSMYRGSIGVCVCVWLAVTDGNETMSW